MDLTQTSSRPIFLTTRWKGFSWECADGLRRRCFPVVAAWVADCPEHQLITRTRQFACPRCEIPIEETGHENHRDRRQTIRDQEEIRKLVDINDDSALQTLDNKNVFPVPNVFWKLPMCNAYRLWQPDVLHQVWIGVSATMMGWITKWLKKHKLLARFNTRWKLKAKFPYLLNFTKNHDAVRQWTGKERRQMMRILVPVLIPLLVGSNGRPHNPVFGNVLRCVQAFTRFSLGCTQRSHSEESLLDLELNLNDFYRHKSVFRDHLPSEKRAKKDIARDLKILVNAKMAKTRGSEPPPA